MKKVIVWMVMFVCLAVLVGCGSKPSGKYVKSKDPNSYIELKPDGTFYLQDGHTTMTGKYKIEGNVLTLTTEGVISVHYKIQGNTITDIGGATWIKGGGVATTPKSSSRGGTYTLKLRGCFTT